MFKRSLNDDAKFQLLINSNKCLLFSSFPLFVQRCFFEVLLVNEALSFDVADDANNIYSSLLYF